MDYLLLGWQTSTYTLKNSDKKWFMKPYSQIVLDTGIAETTIQKYMKWFDDEGFIVRRQALYSRTTSDGNFDVKKGAYITITDKFLSLLQPQTNTPTLPPIKETPKIENGCSPDDDDVALNNALPLCAEINNNEGIDPLKMRGLYIRDLYTFSLNNNINFKKLSQNVDKPTLTKLTHNFETIHDFLYTDIKEEIPDEVKKLILGTFFNLTFEHRKEFTSPKQLVSEYLFALVNVDYYLQNVTCFKHRNNILSKMIRSNQWKTPKGFYKHFYLGAAFKDKHDLREQRWEEQKNREINYEYSFNETPKDERLVRLEGQMLQKGMLIEQFTQSLYEPGSEEQIETIREHIQTLRQELEHLWQEQSQIEQEIERQYLLNSIKHCA